MQIPRPIHPFPARMAASIAWNTLEAQKGTRSLKVLDPMVGSGTTMVIARMLGHQAIGFDTDPLAVLLTSTWCDDLDPEAVTRAASRVAKQANSTWRSIRQRDAYPLNANEDCRAFVRYWFDLANRKQLAAIARAIQSTHNSAIRRALWCAFSRLIVVKQAGASLAMDVAHSRPHRAYSKAPIRALDHFSHNVRRVLEASPFSKRDQRYPRPEIRVGDARALALDQDTIDVVITSPPYLNAIDYMRGHRLTLVWMNHALEDLRAIRSANIGTEAGRSDKPDDHGLAAAFEAGTLCRELSKADHGMFTRYLRDMRQVMGEVQRVLVSGGLAVFVVGDCNVRGVFVRNSAAIKALAEQQGLKFLDKRTRTLPNDRRYLPPPSSQGPSGGLAKRLRKEVVLSFQCR
jgi:DNA modification methylase